jgi:hypothetical protein
MRKLWGRSWEFYEDLELGIFIRDIIYIYYEEIIGFIFIKRFSFCDFY